MKILRKYTEILQGITKGFQKNPRKKLKNPEEKTEPKKLKKRDFASFCKFVKVFASFCKFCTKNLQKLSKTFKNFQKLSKTFKIDFASF